MTGPGDIGGQGRNLPANFILIKQRMVVNQYLDTSKVTYRIGFAAASVVAPMQAKTTIIGLTSPYGNPAIFASSNERY